MDSAHILKVVIYQKQMCKVKKKKKKCQVLVPYEQDQSKILSNNEAVYFNI